MITITFIGYGNVAQHLITAFLSHKALSIQQIFVRNPDTKLTVPPEIECISDWNALRPADVIIIAVSDGSINEVSEKIPFKNQLVVHTSGVVSLQNLSANNRRGVFYPLQTFTKGKKVDFTEIPICLETEFASDFEILEKLAQTISNETYAINSEQRKALHVAAVFVNNFVNHLYQMGNEICAEHQIPFSILQALITETALKINTLTPIEAQTGPAKRNDQSTINAHLDFLNSDENKKNIYTLLTQSIQSYGKKL